LEEINTLRRAEGLKTIEIDILLIEAAQNYAEEMGKEKRFSHIDGKGRRGQERLKAIGGTSILVGEVLAFGKDLGQVVAAWIKSKDHYDVLLNPRWSHGGVGVYKEKEHYFIVGLFIEKVFKRIDITKSSSGYKIQCSLVQPRKKSYFLSIAEKIYPFEELSKDQLRFELKTQSDFIYIQLGYLNDYDPVITDSVVLRKGDEKP
jgi:hypothetical protein